MWLASASIELLFESIRRHAEIAEVGRQRFPGRLSEKNRSWREYRNYLRQALSNFDAATTVTNRSASLLYYYAMLNFAKAELLDTNFTQIANAPIRHGLSYSPARARTVTGDTLKVTDGVFPLLYKRRTGRALPRGTTLPVKRLLGNIPEIGTQLEDTHLGRSATVGLYHLLAMDSSSSWTILAMPENALNDKNTTSKLLFRNFRKVSQPANWRDHFGVSRRWTASMCFLESVETIPLHGGIDLDVPKTLELTWQIKDIIGLRTDEIYDAVLVPFLHDSKKLIMPPSLARYAIIYYASSLVRYKPSAFDAQLYPEQAYLFAAIVRECALPMLIDTLSALEGRHQFFYAADSFRL